MPGQVDLAGGDRKAQAQHVAGLGRLDDAIVPEPGGGVIGRALLLELAARLAVEPFDLGLVGIAARMAGASAVLAADIDPWSGTAIRLNAALNGVSVDCSAENLVGRDAGWDVVLAGDVFYDRGFADVLIPWFSSLAARGATVLVGDPGRAYCPRDRMEALATYQVPVTRALEDSEVKKTTVWRFTNSGG